MEHLLSPHQLLTDGDIWRQEELFTYINEQVKESGGKIRVFPLGIGNGVSSALIEGLARAGNGFSQSVQEGERLDNSVVRMLRGALTPHITDYTLEIKYEKDDDDFELIDQVTEGLEVLLSDSDTSQQMPQDPKPTISLFNATADPEKEDFKMQDVDYLPKLPHPKLLQAPHQIPSLFAFSRTNVYLLMSPETVQRNPTAVVLRATSAHGPLALEIPIEALPTPAETIHQLAAKKAVQDLEEGRGWIFEAKDQAGILVKDFHQSRFEDLVQREAVRLGEQLQVAGKWCSFVAVEANDAEIAGAKQAETIQSVEAEESGDGFELVSNSCDFSCGSDDWVSSASTPKPKTAFSGFEDYKNSPSTNLQFSCAIANLRLLQSTSSTLDTSHFELEFAHAAPADSYVGGTTVPEIMQQQFTGWSYNRPEVQQARIVGTTRKVDNKSLLCSSQSLQDNQMQHMLLGQQNKKRFMPAPQGLQSSSQVPLTPRPNRSYGQFIHPQQQQPAVSPILACGPPPVQAGAFFGAASFSAQPDNAAQSEPNNFTRDFKKKRSNGSPTLMSLTASNTCFGAPSSAIQDQDTMPSPTNWVTKSVSERVHSLISLQKFEGSWSAKDSEIFCIMALEVPKAPEGVDEKIWVTLLVTAYLEIKCATEEGTWGLVVEKAKDWVSATTGLEPAWKQARDWIMK